MNENQKRLKKLEKLTRQLGYTAYKIMLLSGRDMYQITGNGLVILVKKWNFAPNEFVMAEDFILKGEHDANNKS